LYVSMAAAGSVPLMYLLNEVIPSVSTTTPRES
jgi:hypothetical protein